MPSQTIQWFPGHMAKTRRLIQENLSKVDIVLEVRDARIPQSSANPEIASLCSGKPVITLMNKCSLADPGINKLWREYAKQNGQHYLFTDCMTGEGLPSIMPGIRSVLCEKLVRYDSKGMSGRQLKAMIVGIPNVGKSSLINRLSGGKKTKVENRPGVTLTKQWVEASPELVLMDMPGVLWPKFDSRTSGENLAMTGAIKDDILDSVTLSLCLIGRLRSICPEKLSLRYKLSPDTDLMSLSPEEIFGIIAKKRGFIIKGGQIDADRTALMLLDEFRSAKIGRISLEKPE